MRSIVPLLLSASLTLMAFSVRAQTTEMHLQGPSDQLFPFVVFRDSDMAGAGVFANKATNSTVRISNGWVGPPGAGIFAGSPDKRIRTMPCALLARASSGGKDFLRTLGGECTAERYWHQSEVLPDLNVGGAAGKSEGYSLAKPMRGAVGSLSVNGIQLISDGSVDAGKVQTTRFGLVEILFRAEVDSPKLILILNRDQVQKLRALMPEAVKKSF
jgi:hypothetical protein